MPMAKLYAYLLGKKPVTPIFVKPKDNPPLPGFDSSEKNVSSIFGAKGHMLEECIHLRHRIQDNNKLVQFDNAVGPNVITNPLPPY